MFVTWMASLERALRFHVRGRSGGSCSDIQKQHADLDFTRIQGIKSQCALCQYFAERLPLFEQDTHVQATSGLTVHEIEPTPCITG